MEPRLCPRCGRLSPPTASACLCGHLFGRTTGGSDGPDGDLYAELGVSGTATPEEIRAAYRREAMRWHPDRNPGDDAAEEKFKRIAEAYSVLSNPERRQQYDAEGEAPYRRYQGSRYSHRMDAQSAAAMFWSEMLAVASELTMQNVPASSIAEELMRRGCPDSVAHNIAMTVEGRRIARVRAAAGPFMLRSALSVIGGAVLTAVLARFGYLAFLGPLLILNGIYNFVRGLYHLTTGRAPTRR